jgi:hypothetical protein
MISVGSCLRRHPLAMQAFFKRSLVVTWAYPLDILRPLLPPGLVLHGLDGYGFLATAVVTARALRPVGLPKWAGVDVVLTGYRVFARMPRANGKDLIGLRILRSDVSNPLVGRIGNRLTHYGFRPADAEVQDDGQTLKIAVRTADGAADFAASAHLAEEASLPAGSPFPKLSVARRFAGPLPNTFDYEQETHSIIVIEGVRSRWEPKQIRVEVERCGFLDDPRFQGVKPIMAGAFVVSGVPYRWRRGVRIPLADVAGVA